MVKTIEIHRSLFLTCPAMGPTYVLESTVIFQRADIYMQINGKKIGKGCTKLLREGNEIAFGASHPQPQNGGIEDYRELLAVCRPIGCNMDLFFFSGFVYRHTAAGQPEEGLYAHYDIGTELGKGSFATVMKAISRTTGQWFAVKMIHKDKIQRANENNGSNNSPTSNLSREISILEKLQHPNICSLKEVFYQDGDISPSIYFFNFRFPC